MTLYIETESYYTPRKLQEQIARKLRDNEKLILDVSKLKPGFGFDLNNVTDSINGTGYFERNDNPPPRSNKKPKEAIIDRFNDRYNWGSNGTAVTGLTIDANKFGQNKTFELLEALGKTDTSVESLTIKNLNLNTPKKSKRLTDTLEGIGSLKSIELLSLRSNEKSIDKFVNQLSESTSITDAYMSARDANYVFDSMGYLSTKKPAQLVKDSVVEPTIEYGGLLLTSENFPFGTNPTELSQHHLDKINSLSSDNREREATERAEASKSSLAEIATVTMEQSLKKSGEKSTQVEENLNSAFHKNRLNTNPAEDSHVQRMQKALAERADRKNNELIR